MKPKKKWCRRIFCISAAVIFVPAVGLLTALVTESGQHGLLQLTDKLMDSLSFGRISGNLQDGLELYDIRFQSAGIDTSVERAGLRLDFSCLWRRGVCVEDITVQKPVISINTALLPPSQQEAEEDSGPMERINLPVFVDIKHVNVTNLSLAIDGNQMDLGSFQSAVSLNNENGLTLAPTAINDFSMVTKTTAEEQAKTKRQEQQTAARAEPLDWAKLEQSLTPALLGNLTKVTLPFDMHVQDLQGKNWQYEIVSDGKSTFAVSMTDMQVQADVENDQIELKTLTLNSSMGNITGTGTIRLTDDFPLNATVHADIKDWKQGNELLLPNSTLDLNLFGSLKNSTALSLKTSGGVTAELNAQVELAKDKLPLSVRLSSANVQYPFAANKPEDPLKIENLFLNITGNLLDYHVNMNAQAEGMGAPKTLLRLDAAGKLYAATINSLDLQALGGSLGLTGNADWQHGATWQAAVNLNKINVGAYVKNFPAVLSGKLSTSGSADADTWQVKVPDLEINGTVSKRPLNLKADLSAGQTELLNVSSLLLTYGENKINAGGILSEQSDFKLDINAPDLHGLVPDLRAALVGKAALTGKVTEPNFELDLKGNGIKFGDLQLHNLMAKGKINSVPQIQGNMKIDLAGFNYGDIKVNSLQLDASGNEQKHRLQLRSEGEPVTAQLNLNGSFDRSSQIWKGTISRTEIKSPLGEIKNNQFTVSYDNQTTTATVSNHCWNNSDFDLCFPQTFKAGLNGEIPFEIKRFDLAMVNKLAERDMLQGKLTSKGKVAWFTDKPMKLDLDLNSDGINFAQKMSGKNFKLGITKLNLTARLDNNNLGIKSVVKVQDQGDINADLNLQDIAVARKLSGTLKLHGFNLNLVNQILNKGERVAGDIGASLTLGGDLNAPLLNGSVDVKEIKAVTSSMPFEITNGAVALKFNGNSSTLAANLQTPDSRLEIDGDARWKDLNNWNTRVHAKADQFKLDIPAIAKLKVSPNVEVKASPKLLELSGVVDIPWARIAVESLPDSAVSASSDEVILDGSQVRTRKMKLPSETDGMAIRSDLKIHVGDDVTVNAYGLQSQLRGVLSVRQEKGNLGLFGQIDLKNGRYASYGQDLLIRKGQIAFSGLPSQPMLNIEAIRNPEAMENSDIIAGIKVTGLADAPSIEVFSEPSLSQDQILSYLITGRSLENSGEAGSGGSVGAALLGMGLAKSSKVVGGIGETFGIQDLNLGTSGVGDSSKVVVSGNITPKLQVKYGVGLFDGLAEFTLRYKLLPQLYLQSVSGANQAFDILYQFEF
ncbi:translocation/assembly module TamB domain-containing protein [Pasteurellaceae bacterium LIM206]|nr:translocation/assembly module TamB domain-containing protein [Pasteurellaceae bacterium LIM206]